MQEADGFTATKPFKIVHSVLRTQITSGTLPEGLVLLEGPIADLFGVSRTPVQRALQLLADENLIIRFDGRGYLVPAKTGETRPLRLTLEEAGLSIKENVGEAIQSRGSWENLYSEVETMAAEAMAFGRFRFVETEMAEHFSVSRTVIRDVLGRLQESGLVTKDSRSHWVVGPLTAEALSEYYALRELLEPHALKEAAEFIDPAVLQQMIARIGAAEAIYPDVDPAMLDRIEIDLHVRCVLATPNERLRAVLKQQYLPLTTKRMFNHYLGVPATARDLREHRTVIEMLLDNSVVAAAAVLADHLRHAKERSLLRLKLLALVSEPDIAPYLRPAE